jgi:hypothetical protein
MSNVVHLNHVFLFDIDGVLCEPQSEVDSNILAALLTLQDDYPVYLVTGNSYTKSVDMVGNFFPVFCNNADELRDDGSLEWQDIETTPLPEDLFRGFPMKANNSLEWRSPRFVNVCMIGRYATKEQRIKADNTWREMFIRDIKRKDVEAVIGGSVSVDVYSKGADKSRAGKWLNDNGYTFTFIGDKTDPGGNDYPLVKYCEEHPENRWFKSEGTAHTLKIIEGLCAQ